jgi:hypothetical protein
MLSPRIRRFSLVVLALILVASVSLSAQDSKRRGRKYKSPPPTARVEVTILRDIDSKPIENASVVFHLVGDQGNMELKTNEDGKTMIDVLPVGSTIRLQILAKGYQTYGEDFKVDKASLNLGVRLKRPGEQYSIYKNHDQKPEDGSDKDQVADPAKGASPKDPAPKAPEKDTPANPTPPSGAQPQQQ